jgi:hypothetical protein
MLTLNADSFSLEDTVNIGATFYIMKSTLYRHRATSRPKLPTCRQNIYLDFPRTITLETNKTFLVIAFVSTYKAIMRLKKCLEVTLLLESRNGTGMVQVEKFKSGRIRHSRLSHFSNS